MPSKKKKYNARFPPARIKKIMQTDDEVGKVAAAVPVIISRALELFVETLVKNSSEITKARNAKTLTTSHLKACILSDGHFHFLKDLVATIPDVQGEEDPGTPLPLEGQPPVIAPRSSSRGRKPKNRNGESTAGPSHSTAEESETASDDDEDGDVDSEEASSETTCTSDNQVATSLDARTRNQGMNLTPMNQVHLAAAAGTVNNTEDDDYDS